MEALVRPAGAAWRRSIYVGFMPPHGYGFEADYVLRPLIANDTVPDLPEGAADAVATGS